MTEVIAGITIMTILAVVLAVLMTRQQRVAQRLAENRAAARLTESVLIDLQTGKVAQMPADVRTRVQPLDVSETARSMQWVRVEVTQNGRTTSLIGLAPAGAGGKR